MGEFAILLKFTENDLEITSSIIVASLEWVGAFWYFLSPGASGGGQTQTRNLRMMK